ncbi:MAG: cupin domain-containing protein [bacterium]|nr:cupin domain-containing protein [bacterium]
MKQIKNVSGQGKWIFNNSAVPCQLRVMSAQEINSIKHLHKTMHEYFYLVEGHLKLEVEGAVYSLGKDDILLIEPGASHHVVEASPDIKLLLIMPPPVPGDKVLL